MLQACHRLVPQLATGRPGREPHVSQDGAGQLATWRGYSRRSLHEHKLQCELSLKGVVLCQPLLNCLRSTCASASEPCSGMPIPYHQRRRHKREAASYRTTAAALLQHVNLMDLQARSGVGGHSRAVLTQQLLCASLPWGKWLRSHIHTRAANPTRKRQALQRALCCRDLGPLAGWLLCFGQPEKMIMERKPKIQDSRAAVHASLRSRHRRQAAHAGHRPDDSVALLRVANQLTNENQADTL